MLTPPRAQPRLARLQLGLRSMTACPAMPLPHRGEVGPRPPPSAGPPTYGVPAPAMPHVRARASRQGVTGLRHPARRAGPPLRAGGPRRVGDAALRVLLAPQRVRLLLCFPFPLPVRLPAAAPARLPAPDVACRGLPKTWTSPPSALAGRRRPAARARHHRRPPPLRPLPHQQPRPPRHHPHITVLRGQGPAPPVSAAVVESLEPPDACGCVPGRLAARRPLRGWGPRRPLRSRRAARLPYPAAAAHGAGSGPPAAGGRPGRTRGPAPLRHRPAR